MEETDPLAETGMAYYVYGEQNVAKPLPSGRRNPPVRKIVEAQIAEFEKLITERKELLKALDEQPGVELVLDKLRKLNL